jgi:hypothetical protein
MNTRLPAGERREQIIAVFRECCSQGFGETLSLE